MLSGRVDELQAAASAIWQRHQPRGGARVVVVVADQPAVQWGMAGVGGFVPEPNCQFRAGSVAKLLNAVGAARLAGEGVLDLDAPMSRVLADFQPPNAESVPTAAQLLSHTSGLQRESPLGHYFDDSQPTLAQTVNAALRCALVNQPGRRCKYSNIGPSIVGRAVEVLTGTPYAHWMKANVLLPLGMANSTFAAADAGWQNLAPASMRVAGEDETFTMMPAPRFALGTVPAGELVTTAQDLGRFLQWLLGRGADSLLPDALFERLVTPIRPGPYGLGFHIAEYRGMRTCSHAGAIYGFCSMLIALPDHGVGVAVLANEDLVMGPVRDVAYRIVDQLLDEHAGPGESSGVMSEASAGLFAHNDLWCCIPESGLRSAFNLSGQVVRVVRDVTGAHYAESLVWPRTRFGGTKDGCVKLGDRLFSPMLPTYTDWPRDAVGGYGPAICGVLIRERLGHAYAMTENAFEYQLTPTGNDTFVMPHGLYEGEMIQLIRDHAGHITHMELGGIALRRRPDVLGQY